VQREHDPVVVPVLVAHDPFPSRFPLDHGRRATCRGAGCPCNDAAAARDTIRHGHPGQRSTTEKSIIATIVEIGSLRERIEIIDLPIGGARPRIGRIRHANGENAPIDHETLQRLARSAEQAAGHRGTGDRRGGVLLA